MKAPQIIVICILGIKLLLSAYLHKKEAREYNFWYILFNVGMLTGLLIWGGFFRVLL